MSQQSYTGEMPEQSMTQGSIYAGLDSVAELDAALAKLHIPQNLTSVGPPEQSEATASTLISPIEVTPETEDIIPVSPLVAILRANPTINALIRSGRLTVGNSGAYAAKDLDAMTFFERSAEEARQNLARAYGGGRSTDARNRAENFADFANDEDYDDDLWDDYDIAPRQQHFGRRLGKLILGGILTLGLSEVVLAGVGAYENVQHVQSKHTEEVAFAGAMSALADGNSFILHHLGVK